MSLDRSFDDNEVADLASVVAEFPDNDDMPGEQIPIKKLSEEFDLAASGSKSDDSMKVYLRVRPISDKRDSTVTVESDTAISTSAPESSKRAHYTKTEERHYVSGCTGFIINVFYLSNFHLQFPSIRPLLVCLHRKLLRRMCIIQLLVLCARDFSQVRAAH